MPQVRPFRGIEYALDRFGAPVVPERVRLPDAPPRAPERRVADLTDIVCPPYDVIDAELQAGLLARHPRNAVRLELSAESRPHEAAAGELREWLAGGVLVRRAEPTAYRYAHGTPRRPDSPAVEGVLARVRLEPFGDEVRAHEHTMPGPKADRLALLHATRTQLSPILAIYFDRSRRDRGGTAGQPGDEWQARDGDGLLHVVTAIGQDAGLLDHLSRQRLYIADGHHRYETALAYQAEVRADPRWADAAPGSLAADWIMMVLVNAEAEELEVLATHRLILGADAGALRDLVSGESPLWQAIPTAPEQLAGRLGDLLEAEEPVFGVVLPGDEGWLLVGDAAGVADRMRREGTSSAVRGLDLAILHAIVLGDGLGIEPGHVAGGERLAYTRDEAEARAAVRRGDAAAAILVRPTRLDQLAEVAGAGEVMPQKSTYFYPKLLTGFVFNPLEGD